MPALDNTNVISRIASSTTAFYAQNGSAVAWILGITLGIVVIQWLIFWFTGTPPVVEEYDDEEY